MGRKSAAGPVPPELARVAPSESFEISEELSIAHISPHGDLFAILGVHGLDLKDQGLGETIRIRVARVALDEVGIAADLSLSCEQLDALPVDGFFYLSLLSELANDVVYTRIVGGVPAVRGNASRVRLSVKGLR